MQEQTTAVTMTAACELFGRHVGRGPAACKGVVLSLTEAHGRPCACACHRQAAGLPESWAEVVALYPPCDEDAELPEDPDGEEVNEAAIELAIEARLELEHFGDYGYDDDDGRWS